MPGAHTGHTHLIRDSEPDFLAASTTSEEGWNHMSSFMKTQHEEKSCKRCSLRFPRSLRPKHSSEQQENQETQTTSIQQDLYIWALNKYARIEFLNKRMNEQKKRVKEQRQNDTGLFLYVDSLLGSSKQCSRYYSPHLANEKT